MIKRDAKGRFIKGGFVERVSLICKQCRVNFKVVPHDAKERIYCSPECRYAAQKGQPSNKKGKLLPDDKKYWGTTRVKLLLDNWEWASKQRLLQLFPEKSWSAIKNQVAYIKTKYKIAVPKRQKSPAWRNEKEICQLYQQGLGSVQLAKKFDATKPTILKILRKNNIKRRGQSEAQKLIVTPERRKALSEQTKKYLKAHPEAKLEHIRNLQEFHEKHPESRSVKQKEWLAKPGNLEKLSKVMKECQNRPEVIEKKKINRAKQKFPLLDATTTEIPVQKELDRRGIIYKKHFPIYDKNKKPVRLVDIAFPEVKLAIECDGDYWHGNPAKFKTLRQVQINRIKMDEEQDTRIKEAGWKIIRIWESDIQKDVSACVDKIERELHLK